MMTDTCLTCGFMITEPGQVYGYAGPVCMCPEEPRMRRRASQQQRVQQHIAAHPEHTLSETLRLEKEELSKELEIQLKVLTAAAELIGRAYSSLMEVSKMAEHIRNKNKLK